VRDSEKRGDASLALIWCKIAMRNYEDHPDLAPVLEIAQRLAWSFGEGYIARYTLERLGGISGAVVSDGRSAAEFVAARLAEVNQQSSIAKGKGVLDPDAKLMHKIKLDNFGLNKNGKKVISSPYFYQNIIMPVMGRRPECMVGKTLIRRGAMVECYDLTTGAELWYNSMTRGWLGFSLCRDTNDIMHQMSDEAIEKGLVNAHEILSVAGHPIARYSDVEEAVKDKAFGEQVEVVYRPRDPNNFHKRLPPKTITLTYTKPPAVLTAEISWALYSGETVVICAKALHNNLMGCEPSRIYCIDLKTGKTLWTKNGQSSVRRMQHSSFLASNNLVPFVTRSAEGRLVKFVDCADGSTRLVCKVRGEGKFAHVLHVGDSITTIFGRKRVCETYDVLTGRLRMSMTLGQGADGEFKIAGERLLTLRDNGGATRVIDMFNGKEIFNKSLGRGSQAIRSKALGRYMVISRTDRNKSVVLFDGLTATYTKIDLDYYFKQVLMQDDSVLFWTFGNIALYDIKTGKALWKKPAYGMSSMYSKAQGRYLRSINLSYQSKPTGQKSPNGRHDIRQYFAKIQIYVINMQTGEPIFDRRMTHPGRVERSCEIIDGRVCLVLSQYLYIYDKPPVKK